jgi:hypothetical protein
MTKCECRDGCHCFQTPGPATLLVTREGAPLQICTRCLLPEHDTLVDTLVPTNPPSMELLSYDPLGWLLLAHGHYDRPPVDKDV